MSTPKPAEDPAWLDLCRAVAKWTPARFRAAVDRLSHNPEQQRALMRARFRFRVDEFLKFVWPDTYYGKWNRYARELFADEPRHWIDRRNAGIVHKTAHAVGRGMGKSTLARGMFAHRVCYGLEAVAVVLSVKTDDAMVWTRTIRGWFSEPNERLTMLFGDVFVTGGVEAFQIHVGQTKCHVKPAGYGSAIRGYNYENVRPTIVVLDDVEDRVRVLNAEQRRMWQEWVNSDVLRLGPKEGGTEFWWRGTILHPDAILARIMARIEPNDGWDNKLFKALLREPDNRELWEACAAVFHNKARFPDPKIRLRAARRFYERNREAMDAGAEVLDPDLLPLFKLMTIRWTEGESAFRRELQNDPRDPSTSIFDTTKFKRCRVIRESGKVLIRAADGRIVDADTCRRIVMWDPAAGGASSTADFAAIFVGLRDEYGYVYVVDGVLIKKPIKTQLAAAWDMAERWRASRLVFESNGTMAMLEKAIEDERNERRKTPGRHHAVALLPVTSSENKNERIATLEVPVSAGYLQFADAGLPDELFMQFDDFTGLGGRNSQHDDGPDAVQRLYEQLSVSGSPQMVTPAGRSY